MTGAERIEQLRQTRPDVAIVVTREVDSYFSWDGDGPDPRDEGYSPYDVDVKAVAVRKGKLVEGVASLGGSYFLPDEDTGEVHGYLPQLIEEAVRELDKILAP